MAWNYPDPQKSPWGTKRALARILSIGDREVRIAGLGSMLVGVPLLFLIN